MAQKLLDQELSRFAQSEKIENMYSIRSSWGGQGMTRDEISKRLCFLRSQKSKIVRAMRGAAPSVVLAVSALAGAQVALADEPGRVQISFETSGPEQSAFEAQALSPEELTEVRGAGNDSGPPQLDSGSDTAVILFDEVGGKRGSGTSKTSYNAGLGTSLGSSITGNAR